MMEKFVTAFISCLRKVILNNLFNFNIYKNCRICYTYNWRDRNENKKIYKEYYIGSYF